MAISWGESVAEAILQVRSRDGSDTVVEYTPGSGAGIWLPTPPGFAPALLPNWPSVMPFSMISGSQFRPPLPPGLDSGLWASESGAELGGYVVENLLRPMPGKSQHGH